MKRVVSALLLAGVLVSHHVIFSYSGWLNLETRQKSANDKDEGLFLSELTIPKMGWYVNPKDYGENASWKRVSRE
jgi:hypothetical protein